ncbi:MarR family winged helix-turn-helix transcriptional regulator [Nocardia transvalensis]|uniref:MarR family winged helix-turn-helix transcriptional regulator n=1 Tax=Nocardia transvalensis TaxID=37333 RepID=UPI001895584E|nr:helix-turn-helix domain-containing protein [Nocardia transvalensis]MBF6327116.1 winged helix-turn-helix transcriptional regulator [Nocardia transvalensis]
MTQRPLDSRGVFLLSQIGYHVSYRFMDRLALHDLDPAYIAVLGHLAATDGRSQQELADLLRVHRNAMVGLVDELQERGLVERRPHPVDRRAHAVHLTAEARAALAAAESEADALEAEILAPLDDAERTRLIALLDRISAHAALPAGVHPGLQRRRRPHRK